MSTGLRPLPFKRPLPISQHGPRPYALPYIWSTTGKRDVGILESLSTGRIWDQLYLNPFVPFEHSVVASAPSLLPWMHLLKNRTLLFKAANLPVALKTFLTRPSNRRHLQNWMTWVLAPQNFSHEPITNKHPPPLHSDHMSQDSSHEITEHCLPARHTAQDAEMLTMRRPLIHCNAHLLCRQKTAAALWSWTRSSTNRPRGRRRNERHKLVSGCRSEGSGFLSRQLLEARTERVQDGKEMKGMLLQLGHFAGHSGSKLLKICLWLSFFFFFFFLIPRRQINSERALWEHLHMSFKYPKYDTGALLRNNYILKRWSRNRGFQKTFNMKSFGTSIEYRFT